MEIKISGEPREIAALVVGLQGQLLLESNYVISNYLCSEKNKDVLMTEFQRESKHIFQGQTQIREIKTRTRISFNLDFLAQQELFCWFSLQ